MKDKLIQIRADAEFLSRLEYLQFINGFKSISETIRKIVEKEWRKDGLIKEQKTGWILCSEKLPNIGEDVLVCDKDGVIALCSLSSNDGLHWSEADGYESFIKAIAWQPLPNPVY